MLKGITAICLAVGLFFPNPAEATHVTPEVGMEIIISNICYDTKKYYEEINEVAKNKGFQAGKNKYWAVMADKDTPCYTGIRIPVVLGEMVNETRNIENLVGVCFHSQIWEVFLVLANSSKRKAYVNWHVKCADLNA